VIPDRKGWEWRSGCSGRPSGQGIRQTRHTQSRSDDTPQTGPFGVMIAAIARTANNLRVLQLSTGTTKNLCASLVGAYHMVTRSSVSKGAHGSLLRIRIAMNARWEVVLSTLSTVGCGWARKGQWRGDIDRAQLRILTSYLGFRVPCELATVSVQLRSLHLSQ